MKIQYTRASPRGGVVSLTFRAWRLNVLPEGARFGRVDERSDQITPEIVKACAAAHRESRPEEASGFREYEIVEAIYRRMASARLLNSSPKE